MDTTQDLGTVIATLCEGQDILVKFKDVRKPKAYTVAWTKDDRACLLGTRGAARMLEQACSMRDYFTVTGINADVESIEVLTPATTEWRTIGAVA